MAKKAKLGKTPVVGDSKDGARPSKKKQVPATLKSNKAPFTGKGGSNRAARIAKMEKTDQAC